MHHVKLQSIKRVKIMIIIIIILTINLTGCKNNRQFISLFKNEQDVFALQSNGAVYDLSSDANAEKSVYKLPVSDDNTGFFQDGYYYYVDGREIISYALSNQTSKVLCRVKSDEYPQIRLVMGNQIVFKTSKKVNNTYGQYAYFDYNLLTKEVTHLTGDYFPSTHIINFLAAYENTLYFTNQNTLKLAVINLEDMSVKDLSDQLTFAPSNACISNNILYLCAWRQALYTTPISGEPVLQQVDLKKSNRNPGAMVPYGNGILISLDDGDLYSAVYYLSSKDLSITQMSDSQLQAWNVWHILGNGNRFYVIDSDGQAIKSGIPPVAMMEVSGSVTWN